MEMIDHDLDVSDEKDIDNDDLDKELVTAQPLSIVEEDASLSPDDSGTLSHGLLDDGDEEITYQLRSAEGVTYRVVSVGADDLSDALPQIVASNGTSFSNSSTQGQGVQALLTNPVNGQLYVIGSSQEVFNQNNQRNVVPRGVSQNLQLGAATSPQCRPEQSEKLNAVLLKRVFVSKHSNALGAKGKRSFKRDDRRRATHNEVERRRRDKINNWIMKLSKIIPDCSQDTGKGFETQSKGGILAKACDYIMELRSCNQGLMEFSKENEQLSSDLENMARQLDELRHENEQLRTQLADNGISPCFNPLTIT